MLVRRRSIHDARRQDPFCETWTQRVGIKFLLHRRGLAREQPQEQALDELLDGLLLQRE
jgi:hypothetical protein